MADSTTQYLSLHGNYRSSKCQNSYMELSCSRGGVVKLTFFQDFANLFNNNESLVSHKNSMDYNEGNFLKLLSQFYQSMT